MRILAVLVSNFIINPYAFGTSTPPPTPDYADDFEAHAVATGIPTGWAQIAAGAGVLNPTWSVTDSSPLSGTKSLQAASAGTGQRGLGFTGSSMLDGEIEALLSVVSAGGSSNAQPGIIARATDANNWIGARISTHTASTRALQLYHIASGVDTSDTDPYNFATGTTYRLKLVMASGVATATAYDTSDTLLATASLAITLTAGQVGLWVVGVAPTIKYDNFKATIYP